MSYVSIRFIYIIQTSLKTMVFSFLKIYVRKLKSSDKTWSTWYLNISVYRFFTALGQKFLMFIPVKHGSWLLVGLITSSHDTVWSAF